MYDTHRLLPAQGRSRRPAAAACALMLSGDLHHYARYAGPGPAAHHLRRRRRLPVRHARAAQDRSRCRRRSRSSARRATSEEYELATDVPVRSCARARWAPACSPGCPCATGLPGPARRPAHAAAARRWTTSDGRRSRRLPGFLMIAVVFGLTAVLRGRADRRAAASPSTTSLGVVHGLVQIGMGVGGLLVWRLLPFDALALAAARSSPRPVIYGPVAGGGRRPRSSRSTCWSPAGSGSTSTSCSPARASRATRASCACTSARDGSLTIYPIGAGHGQQALAGRPGRADGAVDRPGRAAAAAADRAPHR